MTKIKPMLILMIGLPRSGKSTFVNKVLSTANYTYISADNIREELTGDKTIQSNDKEVWKLLYERFDNAIKNKENIVVDNTNLKLKYRKRFVDPALKEDYFIIYASFMKVPEDIILDRIEKTNFPIDVYHRMKNGFEDFTEEEWEKCNIINYAVPYVKK